MSVAYSIPGGVRVMTWLGPGGALYRMVFGLGAVALVPVFVWLFQLPALVSEVQGVERAAVVRRYPLAIACSAGWIVACVAVGGIGFHFADGVAASLTFGAAMDLVEEVQARRRLGALVAVWPVHRLYAVEPLRARLTAAGIPSHARALRFRTMLQFFGPYTPVQLLVPSARAAEAASLLRLHSGRRPDEDDRLGRIFA